MLVRVKSVFIDKYTNKTYKLGEKIEVSAERYNEIKQFVEIIKTKKG